MSSIKGQIISGKFGEILIRQKAGEKIDIGELLVVESEGAKYILQVFDLVYGSQLSQQNLELISGMVLEENVDPEFIDGNLRNYVVAKVKGIITINGNNAMLCKNLPEFFSNVRKITKEDLSFLTKPENPIFFGNLRSGSEVIDMEIAIDGPKVLQHHMLIAATTGRGKSNLVKVMLWNILNQDYAGILVLDPHDEYYGRNGKGLKDHHNKNKVVYYSKNPLPGTRSLKINIKHIRPAHFNGIISWSDAQLDALYAYYRKFGENWIESIVLEKGLDDVEFHSGTLSVVRRKLISLLDLHKREDIVYSNGIFDVQAGQTTIKDIVSDLENSKTAIIDTSSIPGSTELLIGSLVASEIFHKYKMSKLDNSAIKKPVVSIVLEEAPRVLGKEVLAKGTNIFETIAREGRKFKVGLVAITQLPSMIPREILANINTKIILGIEMGPERQAIIDSAAQDLSEDNRNIASLDRGEAIVSSNFARFAMPIKIPFFEGDLNQNSNKKTESYQKQYLGIEII